MKTKKILKKTIDAIEYKLLEANLSEYYTLYWKINKKGEPVVKVIAEDGTKIKSVINDDFVASSEMIFQKIIDHQNSLNPDKVFIEELTSKIFNELSETEQTYANYYGILEKYINDCLIEKHLVSDSDLTIESISPYILLPDSNELYDVLEHMILFSKLINGEKKFLYAYKCQESFLAYCSPHGRPDIAPESLDDLKNHTIQFLEKQYEYRKQRISAINEHPECFVSQAYIQHTIHNDAKLQMLTAEELDENQPGYFYKPDLLLNYNAGIFPKFRIFNYDSMDIQYYYISLNSSDLTILLSLDDTTRETQIHSILEDVQRETLNHENYQLTPVSVREDVLFLQSKNGTYDIFNPNVMEELKTKFNLDTNNPNVLVTSLSVGECFISKDTPQMIEMWNDFKTDIYTDFGVTRSHEPIIYNIFDKTLTYPSENLELLTSNSASHQPSITPTQDSAITITIDFNNEEDYEEDYEEEVDYDY